MQTRQMVKTLKDLLLIEEFIKRGARVPIVKAQFPHIPDNPIRELYFSIHGQISRRGLTPESTLTMNKSHDQVLHANTFLNIYKSVGGKEIYETLNAETIIEAYDQYKALNLEEKGSLGFLAVWYIARDIRSKIIEVKYCRKCGVEHLYALVDPRWHNCPFCRTAKRGKGRARRAATKMNKVAAMAPA